MESLLLCAGYDRKLALLDQVNNVDLSIVELRIKEEVSKIMETQAQLEFEDQKNTQLKQTQANNSNLFEEASQFKTDVGRMVEGSFRTELSILCEQFQIEQRKVFLREKITSLNDRMSILEQEKKCLNQKADLIQSKARTILRTRRVVLESISQDELETNYFIKNKLHC